MSLITQTDGEEPDMLDVILNAIRSNQLELNTVMPATVVSYDLSTQTCSVKPSFKRTQIDIETSYSRGQINEVPVMFPGSGGRGTSFPLKKDDSVLLIFSQRSLDDWLVKGGEVKLTDSRLHNMTDAIAIPGILPSSKAMSGLKEGYTIDDDKFFIGDLTGEITLSTGPLEAEIFASAAETIRQIVLLPLISSMGPVNFAGSVVTDLEAIATMLEGFAP